MKTTQLQKMSYNQLIDTIHVLSDIIRHQDSKILYATQNKSQELLTLCVEELQVRLTND